jgi:tRNA(Ile)-lysidine synthase
MIVAPAADPLLERLRAGGMLGPGRRVVVLLSGGRDSTCLLHTAAALCGAPAVMALHADYGLREAAALDRSHCEALCASLGVTLRVHRPAGGPRGNVQAWAREERMRAALELADEVDGGAVVAAAHSADDQVETILYRLLSSPSPRAIGGMRARHGRLVRPLLGEPRAELAAYCERHGLAWREDESNRSPAYVRNRIRHELLPLVRELHPGAEANLLRLAERLREQQEAVEALALDALGGGDAVDLADLAELAPALRRVTLQRLADEVLGAPAAGIASRAEEVAALPRRGRAELHLGHGLRAVTEDGRLRVERMSLEPGRRIGEKTSSIHSGT